MSGMEISLWGANNTRLTLYRSVTIAPKEGELPPVMYSLDSGFEQVLQPKLQAVYSDSGSHQEFQSLREPNRDIVLGITVEGQTTTDLLDGMRALEGALPFVRDPWDENSRLARLVVKTGKTARWIHVALMESIQWSTENDMLVDNIARGIVTLSGEPFWRDPKVIKDTFSTTFGDTGRGVITIENPGDVVADITWSFKGAAVFVVPDVSFKGSPNDRRLSPASSLLSTPLLEAGETVEVTTDRKRPPIMSSKEERSLVLLRRMRGVYLRNKIPPYTPPTEVGVEYHDGTLINVPIHKITMTIEPRWSAPW